MHLAAANGSVDLLDVMFESQSQLIKDTLDMTDNCGMTPLHKAAMFGRKHCVQLLLKRVSDVKH